MKTKEKWRYIWTRRIRCKREDIDCETHVVLSIVEANSAIEKHKKTKHHEAIRGTSQHFLNSIRQARSPMNTQEVAADPLQPL